MSDKARTLIGLHVAVLLAGGTGLFGRFVSLPELPLVWYRVIVSAVVMVAWMGVRGRLHRVPWKSMLQMAGCGCLLALHWTAFYASIKYSNVSVGVVCVATSGFFTCLFNPLIGGRKTVAADLLISFITIAGILLIFSLDVRYRLGIALGLLSSAIYSIFAIYNVKVGERTGEDSSTMLLYELIGGMLLLTLLMPAAPLLGQGEFSLPSLGDVLYLLLLGSIFSIVPFVLQIEALRKISAFTVNITYNLEPLYSIVFAALLFGETRELSLPFWAGLALVILSVLLQTRRAMKARA